jgi:hypothetical protein
MEAGSHSGIARLVQQSLGTSALFPSYVSVTVYVSYVCIVRVGACSPGLAVEVSGPGWLCPRMKL